MEENQITPHPPQVPPDDDCAKDQVQVEAHLDSSSQSFENENLDTDNVMTSLPSSHDSQTSETSSNTQGTKESKTNCDFEDKATDAKSYHDDLVYEDIVYDQQMVIYNEI